MTMITDRRTLVLAHTTKALLELVQQRHELEAPYAWHTQARENQLPPEGDQWRVWLILAGRGFGKTRTGAETVRQWVTSGHYRRIALVGNTEQDVHHVMIQGESGLLNVHNPWDRDNLPTYNKTDRTITWPNGAIAHMFTAESYERLRGPQFDAAWVDELAKFRAPEAVWDQLMLTLRLGPDPKVVVTTTPKPIPLIESLLKETQVHVTRGSTHDNQANLSPAFLSQILKKYDNTRLGDQEVYGNMLSDTEGALWQRSFFAYRPVEVETLTRLIIAVDPATTSRRTSDETGIIVAGRDAHDHAHILEDLSGRYSPHQWGQKIVEAYHHYKADRVVIEVNQGGEMIEHVIRSIDPNISFRAVHATRGKYIRAEPIAALYEQGRVSHAMPFKTLESQLCSYVPTQKKGSPDRMDALVWALTDLITKPELLPRITRI